MADCATRQQAADILGQSKITSPNEYVTKKQVIEWGGGTEPLDKYIGDYELVSIDDIIASERAIYSTGEISISAKSNMLANVEQGGILIAGEVFDYYTNANYGQIYFTCDSLGKPSNNTFYGELIIDSVDNKLGNDLLIQLHMFTLNVTLYDGNMYSNVRTMIDQLNIFGADGSKIDSQVINKYSDTLMSEPIRYATTIEQLEHIIFRFIVSEIELV